MSTLCSFLFVVFIRFNTKQVMNEVSSRPNFSQIPLASLLLPVFSESSLSVNNSAANISSQDSYRLRHASSRADNHVSVDLSGLFLQVPHRSWLLYSDATPSSIAVRCRSTWADSPAGLQRSASHGLSRARSRPVLRCPWRQPRNEAGCSRRLGDETAVS